MVNVGAPVFVNYLLFEVVKEQYSEAGVPNLIYLLWAWNVKFLLSTLMQVTSINEIIFFSKDKNVLHPVTDIQEIAKDAVLRIS